jgi:cobalt/nickel transport system permease protein
MIEEPFAHGRTIIHRIDPRYKIVFAALLSTVTAVSYHFQTLLFALALASLLIAAARLNFKAVFKRLLVVFGFLLLIWIVLPFTFEGNPLARIGPLAVTRPGVILSAQITLKSFAILLIFISLITTVGFVTLGHAMDRLHIPSKIVHLLLMSYRYIFVIEQEYQRLARATKIRGFQPGTNLHTYKTYAYLIGMLFVRAVARAERVYRAMCCRGFVGRFYCLSEFPAHRRNWIFASLMSLSFIGIVWMEWLVN